MYIVQKVIRLVYCSRVWVYTICYYKEKFSDCNNFTLCASVSISMKLNAIDQLAHRRKLYLLSSSCIVILENNGLLRKWIVQEEIGWAFLYFDWRLFVYRPHWLKGDWSILKISEQNSHMFIIVFLYHMQFYMFCICYESP